MSFLRKHQQFSNSCQLDKDFAGLGERQPSSRRSIASIKPVGSSQSSFACWRASLRSRYAASLASYDIAQVGHANRHPLLTALAVPVVKIESDHPQVHAEPYLQHSRAGI
jgi:hypothetical protein